MIVAGLYSVALTVANTNGSDKLIKTDYILAGSLQVKLSGLIPDSVVCGCNLINFPLSASGATNYTFSVQRPDKITYTTKPDSIFLSLIPAEKKNGSFNSWIKVVGTQGTCSATDSINLRISMPKNDDIENAIRLNPGRNLAYTNFCASAQPGEAAPSTSPLKNTIWFTFQAPSSGVITIDTHGFNNQIAVYDADSYEQLISGNSTSYKVMASNTDRSLSDKTALIKNLALEPYRKYWLQVDGYDGSTGNVVVDLLSNSIEIYPNPTKGNFNVIISNGDDGPANVKIVSLTGQVLFSNEIPVTKEHNNFAFDLSPYPAGLYFIVVTINGSTLKTKLLLQK